MIAAPRDGGDGPRPTRAAPCEPGAGVPGGVARRLRLWAWWRYRAYTRQSWREGFVYKERAALWLVIVGIRVATLLFFWSVVYRGAHSIGGLDRASMFAYVFVTTALTFLFSGLLDRRLVESIVDGAITMDLVRPTDLYTAYLFSFIGQVAFQLVAYVPVVALVGALFFGLRGPREPAAWGLFLISVALGVLLWHSVRWITSLLVFWTETAMGLSRVAGYIVQFLSGSLLPLSFFPRGITGVFYWLPFQSVIYTPTRIFTGMIAPAEGLRLVVLEAAWAVALVAASRLFWRRASRALTVQGG